MKEWFGKGKRIVGKMQGVRPPVRCIIVIILQQMRPTCASRHLYTKLESTTKYKQ